MYIWSYVELGRSHGILAISDLLTVHPKIHCRLYSGKMEIISLAFHRTIYLERGHILADRISVDIGIVICRRFAHHTWLVPFERQGPVGIDRYAVTLHLPFARHCNLVPS